VKDAFRDACVERFKEVVDLSAGEILDAEVISPADIDRHVGNLDKGAIHMGEIIYRRPAYFSSVPDLANYRTPIEGLYYCGSCTHPGGGVVGATAYHAVNVIADDLGVEKWWETGGLNEYKTQ
jgi:phytoene dehydrogenase-like protein